MTQIVLVFQLLFLLPSLSAANLKYRCADNNCPPYLAVVTSPGKSCVGFLKTPDEVVTAAHCLPQEVIDCSKIKVIFPTVGGREGVNTFCKRIVSQSDASPKSVLDADWVILKIEHSPQRDIPFFGGVLVDKKNYQIQKLQIDHAQKLIIFEEQTCPLVFASVLNMSSTKQGDNPTLSLLPCEVKHGSSGAPVVDDAGRIIGLVNGNNTIKGEKLYPTFISDKTTATAVTDINCVGSFLNPCSIVTSLAKNMDLVNESTNRIKSKLVEQRDRDLLKVSSSPIVLEKIRVKAEIEFPKMDRDQEKNGLVSVFRLKPKCLFPDSVLLIKDRKFNLQGQKIDLQAFKYTIFFDEYLRIQSKVETLVDSFVQAVPLSSEDRNNETLRVRVFAKGDIRGEELVLTDCDKLQR